MRSQLCASAADRLPSCVIALAIQQVRDWIGGIGCRCTHPDVSQKFPKTCGVILMQLQEETATGVQVGLGFVMRKILFLLSKYKGNVRK